MKKIILLFVTTLFVLTTSCKKENAESNVGQSDENSTIIEAPATVATPADAKYPVFTFETIEHDFGTITQGDKVSYDFKFKNTGESDLIITDAKGSCGCTVPEYPKTPIKPGEDGTIKVSFDSTGKIGLNSKSVTLTCNIKEGKKIINIKANIKPSSTTK